MIKKIIFRTLLILIAVETALRILSFSYHFYYNYFNRINYNIDSEAFRILCIGESTMAGHGASDYNGWYSKQKSMPALLENMLKEKYPERNFQVFNLGVPGISPSEIKRFLKSHIRFFKPDLIILQIGNNQDWVMNLIPVKNLHTGFLSRFILFIDNLKISKLLCYIKGLRTFLKYPFTYNKTFLGRIINPNFPDKLPDDFGLYLENFHIVTIKKIIRIVRNNNINVLLLDYFDSKINRVLKSISKDMNVPLCDISNVIDYMTQEEIEKKYLSDKFHPNDKGYRFTADAVFKELISNDLLKKRD